MYVLEYGTRVHSSTTSIAICIDMAIHVLQYCNIAIFIAISIAAIQYRYMYCNTGSGIAIPVLIPSTRVPR